MQVLADRYRILRQRGAGGLGQVWVAQDTRLNKQVAIKSLKQSDPATLARFQQEATATASLEHPNIVRVLDYFVENDAPYVVMEFLDGVSLAELVHAMGKLSADRAAALAAQVASGLELAHGRGIIHRDIKPGNIQVVPNPNGGEQAKLLDFGIAKVLDAASLTASGTTMGTPGFMAPEQTLGGDVDPRTDLYALGVTLYYALTARLPYRGKTPQEILAQISTGSFEPLSSVRADLDIGLTRIVERAMHRDIEARHAGASELRQELEAWLAATGSSGEAATYSIGANHAAGGTEVPTRRDAGAAQQAASSLATPGSHPSEPGAAGSHPTTPNGPWVPPQQAAPHVSQAVATPMTANRGATPWLVFGCVALLGLLGLAAAAVFLLRGAIMNPWSNSDLAPALSSPSIPSSAHAARTAPPPAVGDDEPQPEETSAGQPKTGSKPSAHPTSGSKPPSAAPKPAATNTAPAANCRKGQVSCGSQCVYIQTNSRHCGACGKACKADERCNDSRCWKCNGGGFATCNGKCTYIFRDRKNCGGCGIQCPAAQPCLNGKCGFPTAPKPK